MKSFIRETSYKHVKMENHESDVHKTTPDFEDSKINYDIYLQKDICTKG